VSGELTTSDAGEAGGTDDAGEAAARRTRLGRLREAEGRLGRDGLRVLGYLVLAYLLFRLIPSLTTALEDLERLSVPWLLALFGLETLSEMGFVVSWHAIVDPEDALGQYACRRRIDVRLAWAQLGAGMFVPGGSLSSVGAGTWLLKRLGMPLKVTAEREFNLSFLNTTVDALALIVFGVGLAVGVLNGEGDLLLTLVPAGVAAAGVAAALAAAARVRRGEKTPARHARVAAVTTTMSDAVKDTSGLLTHRAGVRAVLGAVAYLFFDVMVLYTAFVAIHAHPVPTFGVVLMAYIIGALGGSLPLPAAIGTVAGIVGTLIVYGVARNAAVAAVVLYQAVGLLVPFAGGGLAYALLRRELRAAGVGEPAPPSP
jgi:hypothetical protein